MIFLSPIAIPENLDYALYFNLLFFGIIALAAFFGFVQGFKRSLWGLIFKIIFVIIFFLTINSASNFIYNADISSILAMIPESMFDFGGASSINDVVISQISAALEVEPEMISGNEDILALVVSLSLFVIKIIYTILYFTVFAVIYKFITFILRLFIIKRKKGKSKLRLLGIIPGALRGVVSVFLMLIIFGGLFDIIGGVSSIASILAEEQEEPATLSLNQTGNRSLHLSPRTSVIQLEESTGEPDISGMLKTIDDLILGYKSNVLTSFASKIQVVDEETEKKTAFNLFLFDRVLSVDYKESSIAIRDEIVILSDAANIYFDSTFYETEDYADIEASEIRGVFTALSNSNLITLIIPLGIEVFADQVETEFPIPVDELYEINWKTELAQTGEILATAFDIADASNLLIEGTDLDQVVLDGDDIKNLFDDIAGSQLANLGIVIAVDYLVSNTEGEISAIITVPDDIVWSDEISAFGSLAQEIFNTNVSIGTLQSGDPVLLLTALSEVDFTVIMESRIITQGLINILSGQADIGMDLSFLVIPDDIVWEDELESILLAVGALAGNVANLDFNDFQLDQIGEIDVEDINTIFESRIMIASLTKQIEELDLGEYSLIIPDSVYDEDGYILKTEFQNIIEGIHTLASQLTCDDGDEECAAAGFDLNKISLLEESHIDTIVLSEILVATIGNIVVDLGEEALTIPSNALENIFVDGISTLTISKTELKNTLLAISALGITDFQNMEMTTELFSNLKDESTSQLDLTKANTILDSNIIHATISKYLIDFSEGAEAVLIVPYLSESEVSLRYMDPHSTIEFVEKAEIINLLAAVVAIDIQDFENIDNLDLGLIAENGDIITDSSILQATISDQLLDLDTDGTINIPEYAYDGTTLIKKTVGTAPNQTQYITKAELMSAFDALAALNITDAENFDGNIDISLLADDTDRLTVLSSAIIQATISEIILDLETDEILNVPYVPADYDSQNPIFIRKTVGTVEYISVSELDAIIRALNILNITDVETFDGNIDLSVLAVDDNGQKVLESSVIHATISDELIKLDTDGTLSLPYLAEDGVTKIRKTVGEVGKETEYVLSTELENVFIALDRLNITDIETFDGVVDISLLADETNRTDVLSSTIIQATISEIIIDLETDETLVVPYVPEDYDSQSPIAIRKTVGTTEYITNTELSSIIVALNILDITDIETFDGDIDLSVLAVDDNGEKVLESSVIHATISDELIKLDTDGTLSLPYLAEDGVTEIRKTVGEVGKETEYVLSTELENVFIALDRLDITDIETFTGTVDLSLLADETNRTDVLSSTIIQATISKEVIDLETSGTLVVPYVPKDYDSQSPVSIRKTVGSTEYITTTELSSIIVALNILNITDIETFDGDIDLSVLAVGDNGERVLESSVIHATVSDQIIVLDNDGKVVLPNLAIDGVTEIRKTVGEVGKETEYILSTELENVFIALDRLDITDIETFTGTVDLSILADDTKRAEVLSSVIIQATISKEVIDLETSGTLVVPYVPKDYDSQSPVSIRKTVGNTEYITNTELSSIIVALNILNITDIETFNGDIDLSILALGDNGERVLESSVIHATVSDQIIVLDNDGKVVLPDLAIDGVTEIRNIVGEVGKETEYVLSTELENVFIALDRLNITDIETFTGTVDLSLLADDTKRAEVLSSVIIQATISKEVIDLETSGTLVVPYAPKDYDSQSPVSIRKTVGSTEYITTTELSSIIVALNILNITDIETFNGDIDLSILAVGNNGQTVLESSVIHATISDKLVGLDNDDKVVLPYYDENNTTLIRFTVGEIGKETEYVLSTELENVFIALDRLNITDIESFTGSVDLSILADDTKRGEVISSVIIQATISETIIDLDTNLTIVAPHFSESEILLRKIADNGPVSTEYISVSEIDKLIIAMNILNITDLDTFNGDIDLSILAVGNNGQRVLESSVIHATISDKLVGLDNADKVTLPYYAEDNLMQIRNTVGEVGKETEYVLSTELENIFVALNILNITDIESFTGSVDLSLLEDETNRTDVLSSVIIQATISETIIDLDTNLTIVAPHFSESEILLRKIADNGPVSTEFISVSEIDKLIIAMNILNITDLDTFNGDIDLSILAVGDNATDVIASDIIQATMSREVISLNDASTINAPYYQDDDTTLVRLSVGELQTETEYVKKLELEALVIALDILGITNIEDFTGSIDLSKFYSLENRNILLMSSIMQATISEQVINLGTSIIVVPTYNELGVETRRLVGTVGKTTDYILKQEIHDLFEALELFAITDINDFTGTITLDQFFESLDPEYDQNQQILLASASMHRTITKQISDLGNSVLAVPTYSITNTRVDFTVLATDYYIEKIEIKALFKALDILSINDITSFNGTVDLTPLFDIPANPNYSDNQDYLLASSLMHKTITNQIKNLGDSVLKVPEIGFDGVTTIDQVVQSNYYIEKFEIKFLIDALNILGISDITGFDGTIDLTKLSAGTDQDRILYSASIHATISMNLFDLDDQVLIVPIYSSLGEVESYRVQKQVNSVDFIYQEEIKALINAFTDMGYSDLSSFGSEINSQKFFDNPNLYLLSASIHATLSDKLINGTGGELVVPDKDILNNTIRIIHSDVVYVEMNETKLLLTALEEIGLTNFSNIAISPTNLFDANTDISVLLASVSMQATISDTLLVGAGDDTTAYGTSTLIIPNYFRETIYVNLVATEQVEKTELEKLIIALKTVGVPDFTGSVPASEITNITDEDLDLKVLASGSMHVTINHMIWGNGNVNTLIPDEREGLALTDLLYNMNNIIIKDEVLAFIIAVKTTSSGSSITNVSFNYTTIASLSEPDRKTVLESLIVQNIMTDQLSVLWNADPFYEPAASDYHDSNTSYFLTDDGIRSVMIHYSII